MKIHKITRQSCPDTTQASIIIKEAARVVYLTNFPIVRRLLKSSWRQWWWMWATRSTKINANQRKSTKINENQWKSTKINENQWKSTKFGNQLIFTKNNSHCRWRPPIIQVPQSSRILSIQNVVKALLAFLDDQRGLGSVATILSGDFLNFHEIP